MDAAENHEVDRLQAKLVLRDLFEAEKNNPGYLENVLSQVDDTTKKRDIKETCTSYVKGNWKPSDVCKVHFRYVPV